MKKEYWEQRICKQEKKDNDDRTEYDRDFSRLIHSSAFRRLQAKTQVLGLGESDFYRTRLTHSMEVAQIGAGINRWLKKGVYPSKLEQNYLDELLPSTALINAICLAHDLGHPPFGHGGEVALNICMREFGGFEGNGQTLRILTKLEKYTENNGMNPTRRLLLGVLKYPIPYSEACNNNFYAKLPSKIWLAKADNQKPPKCYLDSEKDIVEKFIFEKLSRKDRNHFVEAAFSNTKHHKPKFHSLDASIMELADDISYSLHDFEDAISLKLITLDDWKTHNKDKEIFFENCGESSDDLGQQLFSKESYQRKEIIGGLVHKFITNITLEKNELFEEPLLQWNAVMDKRWDELREHIFELVYNKVIKSTNVQLLEFKGQKIVIELFEALSSDPKRLLPKSTYDKYDQGTDAKEKMRVICDYVAGMTDEYATRLYEKIYAPHKGSIFDHL